MPCAGERVHVACDMQVSGGYGLMGIRLYVILLLARY